MPRLSGGAFNRFLDGGGRGNVAQHFAWRKRSACPCVSISSSSGSADEACGVCDTRGNIWADEVFGNAGMTNQTPQKAIAIFGTWEPGDAVLTIPASSPLYAAGRFDRIRALDSTNPGSKIVNPNYNPRLKGTPKVLTRVFWLNPDHTAEIDGGIPVVDSDGRMTWPNNDGPPPDTVYTVEGLFFDEFFVFNPLSSDRNAGTSGLPMKLAARVFDLLGR